ncbi:MAG: DUF4177 domain-containing protein [Planctomycetaceae bacterium]|jgi:hypothetical protein|nr:DUF4177 domain-containing protein [Planctomycetaceae bacterium]
MFYIRDTQGNKQGPLSAAEIKQMAISGAVMPDTIIISENGREFPASKIPGLFTQQSPVSVPEPSLVHDSSKNSDSSDDEHPPESAATVAVPVSNVAIPQAGNQGTLEQQIALLLATIKNAMLLMKIALGFLGAIIIFQIIGVFVQTGQIGFLKQMNAQQNTNLEITNSQLNNIDSQLKNINSQFNKLHNIPSQLTTIQSQLRQPNIKYEYLVIAPFDSMFIDEMDKYGKQGWELISARRATNGNKASYECIMKRPM